MHIKFKNVGAESISTPCYGQTKMVSGIFINRDQHQMIPPVASAPGQINGQVFIPGAQFYLESVSLAGAVIHDGLKYGQRHSFLSESGWPALPPDRPWY